MNLAELQLFNADLLARGTATVNATLRGSLPSGGGVKCWGDNGWGELGDGTTTTARPRWP